MKSTGARDTYLVDLPGMSGETYLDDKFVLGLGDGGVADHLEIYDWTQPNFLLTVLWDQKRNKAQAKKVADAIAAHVRQYPDCPIILTAGSAGCGIAVWALEDLPPGVQVQSAMLIAPAVDPNHDLTRALSHVRHHLYSINSENDWLVLNFATTLFGTADGVHTQGAGLHGFKQVKGANPAEYRKLVQVPYDAKWEELGNAGGHLGGSGRAFAREILAPMLVKDAATISVPGGLLPAGS
ncbi:MAG TPA: hypothetical protein VFC78_00195 [Tepidisphaeraceae bacterium]|nr:hypothetical protein [Tepidisphaeraceae bacterium]